MTIPWKWKLLIREKLQRSEFVEIYNKFFPHGNATKFSQFVFDVFEKVQNDQEGSLFLFTAACGIRVKWPSGKHTRLCIMIEYGPYMGKALTVRVPDLRLESLTKIKI